MKEASCAPREPSAAPRMCKSSGNCALLLLLSLSPLGRRWGPARGPTSNAHVEGGQPFRCASSAGTSQLGSGKEME
eukprot:gene11871-biopygen13967